MEKKFKSGLIAILLSSFFWSACQKTNVSNTSEKTSYEKQVLSYIEKIKVGKDISTIRKIDSIKSRINFSSLETQTVTSEISVINTNLVFDLNPPLENAQNVERISFAVRHGRIVNGQIISVSGNKDPQYLKKLAINFTLSNKSDFTGAISYTQLANPTMHKYQISAGRITAINSIEGRKKEGNSTVQTTSNEEGRTCISYYYVTILFFSDGTQEAAVEYLFTACTYASDPIDPGEGGGGNASRTITKGFNAFPTIPGNDTTVIRSAATIQSEGIEFYNVSWLGSVAIHLNESWSYTETSHIANYSNSPTRLVNLGIVGKIVGDDGNTYDVSGSKEYNWITVWQP
jgi:hypothetical protein